MSGNALQHIRLPRVVFEELARQLDCIPGDAIDAGEARVVDASQKMMQAVPEACTTSPLAENKGMTTLNTGLSGPVSVQVGPGGEMFIRG